MFTYQIKIADSDLASRQAAALLCAQIERRVLAGEKVAIDLSAVFSISESYADELFGVLALRYGLEWLTDHVALHNLKPFVFRAIADAIRQRLSSRSPSTPDIALLAARKALKQRQSRNI
ncbi:MAG: hypothetical protein A3K04_01020 [Gallionellales bacterium RBG_16_56_9]|nr:MAG: hypothetical protein A3K04_01020 [Gallionellales bacterium RBG_16_56_9]